MRRAATHKSSRRRMYAARKFGPFGRMRPLVPLVAAALIAIAGCAAPGADRRSAHPTPTSTPQSPLASATIYWTENDWLWALRASDGHVRWKVGGWSTTLPGGTIGWGPAEPTLVNDVLYFASNADKSAVPTVFALNVADGSTKWQTPVAGCPDGAPLVSDGVIFVAMNGHASGGLSCGGSGWVYALRASDGHVLWRRPSANVVLGTLALTNGILVVANSTYPTDPEVDILTGLRARDGRVVWRLARTNLGVVDVAASGGIVAVATLIPTQHPPTEAICRLGVEAYRTADGVSLWSVEDGHGSNGSRMALADGLIYVHDDDGYLNAHRLADGSLAWRVRTSAPFVGALSLLDNRLYFGSGYQLFVLDAMTGSLIYAYPILPQPSQTDDFVSYYWSRPVLLPEGIAVDAGEFLGTLVDVPCPIAFYVLDMTTGAVLWQRDRWS